MRQPFRKPICGWAIFCVLACAAPVSADDFRVETRVFAEKETAPLDEHLTLFSGGVVYDFALNEPRETVVFDIARDQIIVLNQAQSTRTAYDCDELLRLVAGLKARCAAGKPYLKFLGEPTFSTNYDEATHKLVLASEILTYQAVGEQPKPALAAAQFREFADWSARLNATRPGSMPPFSRLVLNKQLEEKGLLPAEVELALHADTSLPAKKVVLRSTHRYSWRLLPTDQEKIARAMAQVSEYKSVAREKPAGALGVAER